MEDDKKVKKFDRIYRDMQKDILKSFKMGKEKIHRIKRIVQIQTFVSEINQHNSLYEAKDAELFNKVFILKRVFYGKPKLNSANSAVSWKYIKVLYALAADQELTQDLIKDPQEETLDETSLLKNIGLSPEQMKGLMGEMTNEKNTGLQNLVKDLSEQFSSLGNFDPKEVIQTLINPATRENNRLGINFNKILEDTHQKIKSGEIDVSGITQKLTGL